MENATAIGPLGAHTSAAGGAWAALEVGAQIGADTVQLFTANQRRWSSKPLKKEDIDRFLAIRDQMGFRDLMSHASYLINLGSPKTEGLEKSRAAFRQEIARCKALKLRYLNFHPGAALDGSKEACLARIVTSLLGFQADLEGSGLTLLIESTAGQGSLVGATFEELGYIIAATKDKIAVGICLDTCHLFAAGHRVRNQDEWQATLASFDQAVGLNHLCALHLNDSLYPLGAHKDRHAPLGEGKIGLEGFTYLMQAAETRHLPKYLETPGGPPRWRAEIKLLRTISMNRQPTRRGKKTE